MANLIGVSANQCPTNGMLGTLAYQDADAPRLGPITGTPSAETTPTYGSDLLAGIGAFADATGWTLGSGWSITGGQAVYTSGGGTLSATIAVTSGTKYQIDWTHVSGTYSATFTIGAVSVSSPYWNNRSITIVAGATGSLTFSIAMSTGATIDALTVRTVTAAGRAIAYQGVDASGAVAYSLSFTSASLNDTANGVNALSNVTTGANCTATGSDTLKALTTGTYDCAFGSSSLAALTYGYQNSGFGADTGKELVSGVANTLVGFAAGRGITIGSYNTIIGANIANQAAGLVSNIIIANGTGAIKAQHDGSNWTLTGGINLDKTVTAAGTTGAQTINKTTGTVNFAASATSLVVTNSLVTANSIIICTVCTNDTTMKSVAAVAASGSFTMYANAAPTAETRVNFLVTN